jgi:hypothetical protein
MSARASYIRICCFAYYLVGYIMTHPFTCYLDIQNEKASDEEEWFGGMFGGRIYGLEESSTILGRTIRL